ncbi:precorrin-2 dehydrogenase/sirohydrochlorin ferrochelatase family protein [Ferrimonas marina]|uniref:precorrin-2 dehydrogenase n=1 Tax=Ferrimonas marina TaxID=299255 RepID=A0A1M5S6C9_9GAMM|nr:bifunctional precorrin-2 dehydrogenase/sirohydrochlorin ferrochelatase [Ferrimonas marina]SHH34064.1 precorrin-2 dehydrogenase / sirohydrochlorin ferrochelatase [Ferrimonas marina]
MRYLPLFHDTRHLKVLVVGGGEVAARKVALWARSQATITIVSPALVPSLSERVANGTVNHIPSPILEQHLDGQDGVVVATDDAELNRQVAHWARARRQWVNVVDDPEACSVITPAIVDRSPIVVAIGSEGAAPVLVRTLRAQLETLLPTSLGQLAEFIGGQRQRVQQAVAQPRALWERFVARNGLSWNETSPALLTELEQQVDSETESGRIWWVAAGVEAGLLPIDALPQLQRLDRVVLVDEPSERLTELWRRDASVHRIGECGAEQVNAWLAQGEQLLLVAASQSPWQAHWPQLQVLAPGQVPD